ncbi:hypothetical protein HYY75_11175 [bacterium]|nr:hypothetical protein [bacterium]
MKHSSRDNFISRIDFFHFNNGQIAFVLFLIFFSTFVYPSPTWAAGTWDFFEINAQYRGGMKKSFQELGCGLAYFSDLQDGKKQVILHACVKHPEKKKTYYSMRLNLVYSVSDAGISIVSEPYAWFEAFDKDQEPQIKDMVLLLPIVKDGSFLRFGNGQIKINNTLVSVKIDSLKGGKNYEYNVLRPGKTPVEGKFFVDVDQGKSMSVKKFRFKRGKIVTSFVSVPLSQIEGKYKSVAPFNKVVFER